MPLSQTASPKREFRTLKERADPPVLIGEFAPIATRTTRRQLQITPADR